MKLLKNIVTAAALLIMATGLSSCYFRLSDDAKKQFKYDLRYRISEAGGKIDTVTFDVGEFQTVDINMILNDMMLVQTDGEFKVEVMAYDFLIDSIKVTNESGALKIGVSEYCGKVQGMTQVRVYAPTVSRISNSGDGNIIISGFKSDSLSLMSRGSGDIIAYNLDISGDLLINGTGSGDHDLNGINAGNMVVKRTGSGDGNYNGLKVGTLSVTSTGSGDMTFEGEADSASFNRAGSGDIDAQGLKASRVNAEESGSGELKMNWEATKKK